MKTPLSIASLFLVLFFFLSTSESAHAEYDKSFWEHWSDGAAEIATYDTVQLRYSEPRQGLTVAIFVTEPFAEKPRVKADPGVHPESETFSVLKLNLVEDFPTGIYDYNLMTSSFVAIEKGPDITPGSVAKVSFSSQEWCGHMYAQILPRLDKLVFTSHSYFDNEADEQQALKTPKTWVSADALLHWARGLARPFMKPGEEKHLQLLASLKETRLDHVALGWQEARFSIAPKTQEITVPAGTFTVRENQVRRADGKTMRYFVEEQFPHRIIRWTISDDIEASLIATTRVPYWEKNNKAAISELKKLGLSPRAARTP